MPLTTLKINGVGGIGQLSLSLDPHMNILCGPNGIGKTSIIECIAAAFHHGNSTRIKRHALSKQGAIELKGTIGVYDLATLTQLNLFEPDQDEHIAGKHDYAHWILYLGTTRDFAYSKLQVIQNDPKMTDSRQQAYSKAVVELSDVKNWFVQRFLYSAHKDILAPELLRNLEEAKASFGRLQNGFAFHNIDPKRSEIMVSTPTGILPFEYLSSGFRSSIAVVWGIIKEIEHRFPPEEAQADKFAGIIMVDEVELHLHPEWQRRICSLLRASFPAAQFILTTHSPHVVQTAVVDSIIALRHLGEGKLEKATLTSSPYGFRGWTVEEILTDVMGMSSTVSDDLRGAMAKFAAAEANKDPNALRSAFEELDQMLHPASTLRKILQLQTTDMEVTDD